MVQDYTVNTDKPVLSSHSKEAQKVAAKRR